MSTGTLQSRTARLAAVVRRVRLSFLATVLAAGLLLAVAIALAWVLGGVILDLVVPLSVPGRVAVWCGWWAAVVAACGAFLLVPAARRPLVDSIALRIERALGGIHNRLLTVVDLGRRGGAPEGFRTRDGRDFRPELVERLLDQTQERLRGFRMSRVLPWRAVLRNLFIAAACAALMVALFLGLGERFLITLQRLLDPTADIPPATWLQLAGPEDLEVLEGEPFEIEGRVVRGTTDEIELVLYDADGHASRQPMQSAAVGAFTAAMEGLDRPMRYRLEGGNTWTKTHDIRILKRPEIRSLVRRVRLPDYMRIDSPLPVADDAAQIRAPTGAAVEFEAVASAEAATGNLKLFTRMLESRVVERFDERVWFEDDLPRDAVAETPWKWTTAQAAGGLRSFTFAADGRPLVMRTRLDRLVLPRDRLDSRAFMVMARSDANDPPGRLSLLLAHDRGRTELVWGDIAAAPPVAAATRIAAGPLPPPGDWARLTVPMQRLAGLAGQAVGGMTVSVDRGRLLLDRPGWVERSEQVVKQPVDQPAGEVPLGQLDLRSGAADTDTGTSTDTPWLGRVPVERPIWTTIEFRSPQGHPNLPSPPVEIVPTVDRPPSIVLDNTSETVTLKVADDVPLRGRGFDDWGIDELSVIIGPDPEHLGQPLPVPGVVPADRPPSTQLAIATALTPEMLGIGPGKSAAWKLRIRDTKGQIAETKVFRVTVMMPPESELAKTQVPALAQAKKEAESLAKEAEKKARTLDEKQESVRKAVAEQEQPDRRDVEDVTRKLDQEQRDAEQLSKTLSKAAEQAAKSELVPETHKQALAELARKAQALEEQLAGKPQSKASPPPDRATPEKPPATPESKPESKPADKPAQTAAQAQAQKAEAEAERAAAAPKQEEVALAAKEIAREVEKVEQRLNATGAALQLESLAKDLQRRAEDLATQPPASVADDAAKQKTRSQIRDVEQILGQKFPEPKPKLQPKSDPADGPPPEAAAEPKPPSTADTAAQPDAAKPQAAEPEPKPAPQPSTPPTAAEAAAQAASETAAAATRLADRLAGKPQPVQTQADQPQTGTPAPPEAAAAVAAQPTPPAAAAAEGKPSATEKSAADPPATAADIQTLLESKEVEQALAMAERAQRLQARAAEAAAAAAARAQAEKGRQPGDAGRRGADGDARRPDETATSEDTTDPAGRSEGGAVASRADIEAAELLRGLDAKQRAALYKLPPRIRDPLLEGMRQRGPAAYQNVIDTYFRQLGKDIPQ